MTLHFVFLVLEEHPYGREMLRILLERGFRPELVIEEVSAVADEEREKFLTRIAGQPVPPAIADLIAGPGTPRREVDNHNSAACRELLEAFDPELVVLGGTRIAGQPVPPAIADLIAGPGTPRREVDNHNSAACRELLEAFDPELVVLGGTRIIHPTILAIPLLGTVNAHPGLLPELRGSSSVGWALYKDLPVGSTVHFVDAGIDTGPVILRRVLPVYRGETYEQIVRRVLTLSGELMAETLALLEAGKAEATPQDADTEKALRVIPPELLAKAKKDLARGRYSHFAD